MAPAAPALARRAARIALEIVVTPWSEHSRAARLSIGGLVLAALLSSAARSLLRRPAKSSGSGGSGKKPPPGPIWRVLGLLMPKRGEAKTQSGLLEMILVVFFNLAGVGMELVGAAMMQESMALSFARDRAAFQNYLVRSTIFSVAGNLFGTISGQVQARLGRRMRLRLTDIGHSLYFEGANYYRVERQLQDADLRLTDDASAVAYGCTSFFTQAVSTTTTLLSFGALVVWKVGLAYTAIPFIVVLGGGFLKDMIAPMDWSITTRLEAKRSRYRNSWSRVVRHSEAIAALRGGDTEAHQLRGRFNEVVAERQLFNRKYLRFEAGNAMLYEYLMHTVVVAVLMAPSTWRKDGGQESAGDRFAALGSQLGYFMNLLNAAGGMQGIMDQFKRLTGNATRFVELLDALEEINEAERQEQRDNIRAGPTIQFDNVTIKTPTQNLLVRNLSFSVGDGDSMLLTGHNGAGKSSV